MNTIGDKLLEVHVQVFGPFSISTSTHMLQDNDWRAHKGNAIVKMLAIADKHCLARAEITERLWSKEKNKKGKNLELAQANRLAWHLNATYKQLQESLALSPAEARALFSRSPGKIGLSANCIIDIDGFKQAYQRAFTLKDQVSIEKALAYYKGDLLPDDQESIWAEQAKVHEQGVYYRDRFARMLFRLADLHQSQNELDETIACFLRIVRISPEYEDAYQRLMFLYAMKKHHHHAAQQFQRCCVALKKYNNVKQPSVFTLRLTELIRNSHLPLGTPGQSLDDVWKDVNNQLRENGVRLPIVK